MSGPSLLARVRWGNVARLAAAVVLLGVVLAWPRLQGRAPAVPEGRTRPGAPPAPGRRVRRPVAGVEPTRERRAKAPHRPRRRARPARQARPAVRARPVVRAAPPRAATPPAPPSRVAPPRAATPRRRSAPEVTAAEFGVG